MDVLSHTAQSSCQDTYSRGTRCTSSTLLWYKPICSSLERAHYDYDRLEKAIAYRCVWGDSYPPFERLMDAQVKVTTSDSAIRKRSGWVEVLGADAVWISFMP